MTNRDLDLLIGASFAIGMVIGVLLALFAGWGWT